MSAWNHDETVRLRDGNDDAEFESEHAQIQNHTPGSERFVGVIKSSLTNPNVFYRVERLVVLGTEAEGSPGTLTDDFREILAFNLGNKAPAAGTVVECTAVPHRWVFTFGAAAILPVTAA